MTTDTFATLPLTSIVSSPTNPRKTFNAAKLAELAESIKASGLHQPILVRPLPGDRVADTARGTTHEIVAGERRWRASQIAGMAAIPAMVRTLTDNQVLEIQLVENLQRDDLTELEEAEGYEALMAASQITAEAVGSKIGKSRSYVYARLKLLDLCAEGHQALRDGTIDASRGLLLARIPDTKLQIKALGEIVRGFGYQPEPMSVRQAKAHIQDRYMIKLDSAKFDITSIDLLPTAGSCKTCAKRTGHDPDLFAEFKNADVCTDSTCFHAKEEAHGAALVRDAKAKGHTVIAGKAALELMPQQIYNAKFKGYRRLDDATDSPTDQPLRKIIGKLIKADGIDEILIEHPHKKGEMVAVLPNEVVARLLKAVQGQEAAAKAVSKEAKQFVAEKAKKAAEKQKAQFEQGWRDELLISSWKAISATANMDTSAASPDLCRYLCRKMAEQLSSDATDALCKLLDLGKVAPYQALKDYIRDHAHPDQVLALLIMQKDASADDHDWVEHVGNEGLLIVAGDAFGKDYLPSFIEEIKTDIKNRMLEEADSKSAKSPLPLAPAAQAKGVRGAGPKGQGDKAPAAPGGDAPLRKRKMSAADAQAAIASAMQDQDTNPGADAQGIVVDSSQPVAADVADAPKASLAVDTFEVGQKVSVTTDDNKLGKIARKWSGKRGTVTRREPGGGYWDVTFRGRNGGVALFAEDQLESVGA